MNETSFRSHNIKIAGPKNAPKRYVIIFSFILKVSRLPLPVLTYKTRSAQALPSQIRLSLDLNSLPREGINLQPDYIK